MKREGGSLGYNDLLIYSSYNDLALSLTQTLSVSLSPSPSRDRVLDQRDMVLDQTAHVYLLWQIVLSTLSFKLAWKVPGQSGGFNLMTLLRRGAEAFL